LKLVPWVSWFGCDEIYGWIERIEKKCCDGEKEEQRVYGKVKQRIWKWKREREREWVRKKKQWNLNLIGNRMIERTNLERFWRQFMIGTEFFLLFWFWSVVITDCSCWWSKIELSWVQLCSVCCVCVGLWGVRGYF
jgi:hypothetical protein